MNRKATPDILGSLMGEAIKQENHKETKQERNKTRKPATQTYFDGIESPEEIPHSILKEKATFNLSRDVLGDLEDCWIEIRKLRGDKKISKTDIVELALKNAIKEFRFKKQLSKFYGKLASNKAIKK